MLCLNRTKCSPKRIDSGCFDKSCHEADVPRRIQISSYSYQRNLAFASLTLYALRTLVRRSPAEARIYHAHQCSIRLVQCCKTIFCILSDMSAEWCSLVLRVRVALCPRPPRSAIPSRVPPPPRRSLSLSGTGGAKSSTKVQVCLAYPRSTTALEGVWL